VTNKEIGMSIRTIVRWAGVVAIAAVPLVAAACDPVKKTPPPCNLDPNAEFGAGFLGEVDVNGDGTKEAWVATTPNAYPVNVTLYTIVDCRYTQVTLNGSPALLPLNAVNNVGAEGVGCLDLDLNGFLDFVVKRTATTTDGGSTYDLEEVEYALIGTSLSFIDSSTQNIPGGASVLGDIGSLECGSVTYP
jgi:hypothetical protein